MKKLTVKALCQIALLIALEVVFTRLLSIQTPILRISIGFLPIAVIAILHGPLMAGIAFAAGDLIGFTMFATGTFFPGFTLSAFLTGIIYGLFLHGKPVTNARIAMAVGTWALTISLGLNTLWLSIMFENAFVALLPTRIAGTVLMTFIQLVGIRLASIRFYSIIDQNSASTR